jgi:hypothetical protein
MTYPKAFECTKEQIDNLMEAWDKSPHELQRMLTAQAYINFMFLEAQIISYHQLLPKAVTDIVMGMLQRKYFNSVMASSPDFLQRLVQMLAVSLPKIEIPEDPKPQPMEEQ